MARSYAPCSCSLEKDRSSSACRLSWPKPLPPRTSDRRVVATAAAVASREQPAAYYKDEAQAVLKPVERLLMRHKTSFRGVWAIGYSAAEITRLAKKDEAADRHGHSRPQRGRSVHGMRRAEVVSASTPPLVLVK